MSLVLTAACASEGDDAGPELDGDVFGQDEEGKGDSPIAGINENTFKAYGVLNAAASLDVAGWKSVTGASTTKAKKLVEAQKQGGYGSVGLPSLRALVKAGATETMIGKLATYAQEHGHNPGAAIKIPVMDQDGTYLYTRNGDMRDAGLGYFSKHMYLWDGAAGTGQYVYFQGLSDQASEHDIEAYLSTGAGMIAGDGHGTLCYLGNRHDVVSAVSEGISSVWTEQLSIWGWRVGTTVEIEGEDLAVSDLVDALDAGDRTKWNTYDTSSDKVMIASTTSDDGDDPGLDVIARCP